MILSFSLKYLLRDLGSKIIVALVMVSQPVVVYSSCYSFSFDKLSSSRTEFSTMQEKILW